MWHLTPCYIEEELLEILPFFRCLLQQFVAVLKPIRNSVWRQIFTRVSCLICCFYSCQEKQFSYILPPPLTANRFSGIISRHYHFQFQTT